MSRLLRLVKSVQESTRSDKKMCVKYTMEHLLLALKQTFLDHFLEQKYVIAYLCTDLSVTSESLKKCSRALERFPISFCDM